jgi:hypothetical protein
MVRARLAANQYENERNGPCLNWLAHYLSAEAENRLPSYRETRGVTLPRRGTRASGMVDYYKVIQRSAAALTPDTEATRQALYERARAALAKQLCLKTPTLPNDSIRAELSALEDAIKKVESEAWSKQYEIKDKKEIARAEKESARPKRNAASHLISSALLLTAGVAYFILWMRFSCSSSVAAALMLSLVFGLPAAVVFIFAIYPILSPLLWLLRWLSKKSLQRLIGGEIAANAAGATLLSAGLCAIGAIEVPHLFSWWAAGWCWLGCVFLLTLDPGMVRSLRAWLSSLQRPKAAPQGDRKTPVNEGVSAVGIGQQAQEALPEKEALKSVA